MCRLKNIVFSLCCSCGIFVLVPEIIFLLHPLACICATPPAICWHWLVLLPHLLLYVDTGLYCCHSPCHTGMVAIVLYWFDPLTFKGNWRSRPEKSWFLITLLITITPPRPPPYLCASNFRTILLLILCAFKWYVECLDKHIFLEDTCTNIKVTTPNPRQKPSMDGWPNTKIGVLLPNAPSCGRYESDSWGVVVGMNQIHEVLW